MFSSSKENAVVIFLVALLLFYFSGCHKKDGDALSEKEIYTYSMAFCNKLLNNPDVTEVSKNITQKVISMRKNGVVDPAPVLIRANLVRQENKQAFYLVLAVSDEDGDLYSIGIKERHFKAGRPTTIIEEKYPVFAPSSPIELASYRIIPVKIRGNNERKNEDEWNSYINLDKYVKDSMPTFWVSVPAHGKTEIEVSLYDRAGNESDPTILEVKE